VKTYDYKPGQKVVCIDDRFPAQAKEWGTNFPVMGGVYTIHSMQVRMSWTTRKPSLGFTLAELMGPQERTQFATRRFVPLDGGISAIDRKEAESGQSHRQFVISIRQGKPKPATPARSTPLPAGQIPPQRSIGQIRG
jgi:hypothetical protein